MKEATFNAPRKYQLWFLWFCDSMISLYGATEVVQVIALMFLLAVFTVPF